MAGEVFKILHQMSLEYIQDLVNLKALTYHFMKENQAHVPRVNSTRYGLRTFRYEASWIWNCLPNKTRVRSPILSFGGCCVPGLAPYTNALCVRPNVCTLIDVCNVPIFSSPEPKAHKVGH